MTSLFHRILRKIVPVQSLSIIHEKDATDAWLTKNIPKGRWTPPKALLSGIIFKRLLQSDAEGKKPLWEGYKSVNNYARTDMERSAREVSTFGPQGNVFTWLVEERKPDLILEIGTAFGFSGMYFLAGIKQIQKGHLITFEPNDIWSKIAEENLRAVDSRFTLVRSTFEEAGEQNIPKGKRIDLTLIDAIHTSAFVLPEFEAVIAHASAGALIIIDDIDFSDDMRSCWKTLVNDKRVLAAVSLGRFGILELKAM